MIRLLWQPISNIENISSYMRSWYYATTLYIRHEIGQISSYREQFSIYGSIMECLSNRTAYLELRAGKIGRYWRRHKGVFIIVSIRTDVLRDVAVDAGFETHSMDQSPSWETNLSSTSQEIPRILWNQKYHYGLH